LADAPYGGGIEEVGDLHHDLTSADGKIGLPPSALSPVPLLATQGIATAGLDAKPHAAITALSTIGRNLIFSTPRAPRFSGTKVLRGTKY
jgi:hypothetical protein